MKINRSAKIRIIVLVTLGFAFLFFGSIFLSLSTDNENSKSSTLNPNNFISTEVSDLLAQEPPIPTPIPTDATQPPIPTPIPTDVFPVNCVSDFSFSGGGSNLQYVLTVDAINANSSSQSTINLSEYISGNAIELIEYTGNCSESGGVISCDEMEENNAIVFFRILNDYNGVIDLPISTTRSIGGNTETASCNASIEIRGINDPPPGLPEYNPQSPSSGQSSSENCQPLAEYCEPGTNLLDDLDFNQSHDGSFENPVCTQKISGVLDGECNAVGNRATYYEADTSISIPLRAEPFFDNSLARAEYVRQVTVGGTICEEKPQTHGNNSFKIFQPGGNQGINAGLCIPIKNTMSGPIGINFRTTQGRSDSKPEDPGNPYAEVEFRLGYLTRTTNNVNLFGGAQPPLSEGEINWVDSQTVSPSDYGGEGAAYRFAGGFLSGNANGANALCFQAKASTGEGIATFWDAAYAATKDNVCEDALNHSDGIDRSCGGYACEGTEPQISGNFYTDFDQEYYAYDIPEHWNARQCQYEAKSNGADSPFGTLFVGLDLNSCDINYPIANQRNLHPELGEDDVCVGIGDSPANRNWTFGYAWTGGVKDFALLQYLDCAISEVTGDISEGNAKKGTEANQFFCDRLIDGYTNSNNVPQKGGDPNFYVTYQNTYSGLVNAHQGEGTNNFFKVPLLGSAVSSGILNNWQRERLQLDPFLIQKRNSGSGYNNEQKFNLEDTVVSQFLRYEEHLFEKSTIPQSEVLATDLLAGAPVCTDIIGDPVTKFHYGLEGQDSDRAIFGFADDEGSFEHILHAATEEMTPEMVCDSQFIAPEPFGEVVGAECTVLIHVRDNKRVTFTEDNIGNTLEQEGLVGRISVPTLPPPSPTGIPDPNFESCPEQSYCGQNFGCGSTMRDLYNACRSNRPGFNIESISGNPFIRWERPEGWESLNIFGLNKVMEASWENEFTHYNKVIRHENVGIDVNQVVSVYDQQQPKCSIMPDDRLPVYCQEGGSREDPAISKGEQVCRRVDPYNCDCNSGNFATCLIGCTQNFVAPPILPNVGIPIEGGESDSIRGILENTQLSFLEKFIALLRTRTAPSEGAMDHITGEVYSYEPRYSGGFRLANISDEGNTDQCADKNATGASQVRIENYYAYAGQIPRMNERIGFAATNNKDPKTLDQLVIDPSISTIASFQNFIERGGESYPYIAVPYCDLMTEEEKLNCSTTTEKSCDCLIRSCTEQLTDKQSILDRYLPAFCQKIKDEADPLTVAEVNRGPGCLTNLKTGFTKRFQESYDSCISTPKTNLNFNCDPMASYLISQGFDTPQLRLAACEDINNINQCRYDKFGVHLITGPTQEANYNRAEEIGLKWKMEVITEDTDVMVNAMSTSVDSFNGNTVFRFCNADQGPDGAKVQDQSCQFRTELTGSSAESGKKAARMILKVAEKTSKGFYVSPVNEPVSEHWAGGDPNDASNTTTMAGVSEFYKAFTDELNTNQVLKSKIQVGGPTYNVTAFGNYANFEKFHSEFSAKLSVDYWTIYIYNHDELPVGFNTIQEQFTKAKEVFGDSKPIGINETGDFQHNITRLAQSFSTIGSDPRLKYALLFNAFGGWGDVRGQELILTDTEIRSVLSGVKTCPADDQICYDDPTGGGTIKPNPLPFGHNFTLIYDQLLDVGSVGGRGCSERPPAAGVYSDPSDVGMACPGFDARLKLPQYDFYRGALKTCGIPTQQTRWTDGNTYNKSDDIDGIIQTIRSKNIVYNGVKLNDADQDKLRKILTESKRLDRNPMVVISIWGTESAFGRPGNTRNEFGCGSAANFESSLNCILGIPYMVDRSLDEMLDRYGPFCDNETYATTSTGGGGQLVCPDNGTTSPECFVSPMNEPTIVTQCYGNTVERDASNANCLAKFPNITLHGSDYEVIGQFHAGIDLVNSNDSSVFASAVGKVHTVAIHKDYGNYVVIEHELKNSSTVYYTRYAHLQSTSVSEGQTVDHNTKVGVMGNSGCSNDTIPCGIHLHFELLSFPTKQATVYTTRNVLRDPTDIILRDRSVTPPECVAGSSDVTEVASGEGITRYYVSGLVVIKIDKSQYTPGLSWNPNGQTLSTWSQSSDIVVNGSIYEPGPPYTPSGRLKIDGNVIQSTMSSGFSSKDEKGFLAFNGNDIVIKESKDLALSSYSNMLESLPILILDGRKYTQNNTFRRRSSSVGIDNNGNYYIVISPKEGQYSYSDVADFMLGAGFEIKSLISMDGGTSSGVVVKGSGVSFNNSTSRAVPGIVNFNKQ